MCFLFLFFWNEYFMDLIDKYILFYEVCLEIKVIFIKVKKYIGFEFLIL